MNIQLLSDLHLESNPHFVPQAAPKADVLVLAGDIGSYQNESSLTRLGIADFGLGRFASWPCPVVFVPGNHEYDGQEFSAAHARLQEVCQRLGFIWLEHEVVLLQGVRFLGCTLWTDFDALTSTQAVTGAVTLGQQLLARDKACRAANFALKKNHTLTAGQPMLADGVRALGLQSQAWLRQALSVPFEGKTVVVTHFAPSLRSADPRYGRQPGTASFCNADDALIPRADLWLHGHLHCRHDYSVPRAGATPTRVVCQARGLAKRGEDEGYDPLLLLHV